MALHSFLANTLLKLGRDLTSDELLNDVIVATTAGLRFKSMNLLPFHLHQTPGVVAAMCIVAIIFRRTHQTPC